MSSAVDRFIRFCLQVLVIALCVVLAVSLVELLVLVGQSVWRKTAAFNMGPGPVERQGLFLTTVHGFIAAVLLLTIIMELIRSLVEYLRRGSAEYTAIMFEIALIAVVRHLLGLDLEHVEPLLLVGLALLLAVLAYFNLRMGNLGPTPSKGSND